MNQIRVHRLLKIAMQRIERGESTTSVLRAIKASEEEIGDPYSGEIDEFLKEKQVQDPNEEFREEESRVDEDHPQEEAEDKLDEEKPAPEENMPGDEAQDAPQEDLADKYHDEQEETDNDKVDELEERKSDLDEEIDRVQQQNEDAAEASLRAIAKVAKTRGYSALANRLIRATTGGVVEILNGLLMKEYLQRDLCVNYYYLFDESHRQYLTEHMASEKARMAQLQETIVDLGGTPTTNRLAIPGVNPLCADAVMQMNVELEKQAVSDYLAAARSLEGMAEYAGLKVWLKNVALDEEEDVQEFQEKSQG